ncbi:unnamed protein product [Sympodiomycopsis kandeliae]
MGKKNKNQDDAQVAVVEKRSGPDGGILFEANDSTLESTVQQTGLTHVNKPWSRHAWERAIPWVLSQRQKLEGNGWTGGDAIRTELFVLKRPAPHGVYTDDGFIYMRVPKKMIDFFRTAKKNNTEEDDHEDGEDDDEPTSPTGGKPRKKSLSTRANKRRQGRCNYDLSDPNVWKIKIDGAETEELGKEPTVMIDVIEPLENIFYLVMCLQPGLTRLHAWRDNVIQPGTHEVDVREDAEPPTARHRAMMASTESYSRVLPPPYWFKRNRDQLEKILGEGFEPTLEAAENSQRSTVRIVKDVQEKIWEEVVKVDPAVAAAKAKKEKKKSAKKNKLAEEGTGTVAAAA